MFLKPIQSFFARKSISIDELGKRGQSGMVFWWVYGRWTGYHKVKICPGLVKMAFDHGRDCGGYLHMWVDVISVHVVRWPASIAAHHVERLGENMAA